MFTHPPPTHAQKSEPEELLELHSVTHSHFSQSKYWVHPGRLINPQSEYARPLGSQSRNGQSLELLDQLLEDELLLDQLLEDELLLDELLLDELLLDELLLDELLLDELLELELLEHSQTKENI